MLPGCSGHLWQMRLGVVSGVVLVVAGIVLLAISDATIPDTIGFALLGLGGILLTGMLFYAVGRSEDRARASERHGTDSGG